MVRVHRSGNKYEFYPPCKSSIKTRKSRRLSSSSSSKAQAIGAVKITKPAKKRPPPSQSRVNSVTGNKTSVKEEDRPVPVVEVPMLVYCKIQDALKIIKSLETNPSDEDQLNLDCAVEMIHRAATFYNGCLPPEWKFDPATASTIMWKMMMSEDEDDDDPISVVENPHVKFPDIYRVSLNTEQSKLWLEFKKSDENTPTIHGLGLGTLEKTARSIEVNHPYIRFIGAFAVDSFNKTLEMLVKDKHNYLKLDEVITCVYHKMPSEYWFHMTIKATEEEHSDVYATKVQVFTNDGRITLCKFFRPDEAPEGKGEKAIYIPSSATYYDILDVDGWSDPSLCYRATGLIRRNTCKGYNFYIPWGVDRLWI